MPLEKTEAVLLKSFNWSESSRTVVFFSRGFGKIALVDKGGRSLKSKRGRLIPFARLEITFYSSRKESSGYISDVELVEALSFEKDGALGRLAYGSAACELLYLLLPEEESQAALYAYFVGFLKCVEEMNKRSLPGLFLGFFLGLLSQLGYHPSLTCCSSCGRPMNAEDRKPTGDKKTRDVVPFFPERGGILCTTCQTAGDHYIPLSQECFGYLVTLQNTSMTESATVPIGYTDVVRLLEALTQFLSYQTGLKTDLKSLEFLNKLKNSQVTD